MERPNPQWQAGFREFAKAGFTTRTVNPMEMELQTVFCCPGDVVLFDGMLPHLQQFIERTHSYCPEAHLIVTTEADLFTVRHDALFEQGVTYISAPITSNQLVEAVRSSICQETFAAAV